MTEPAAAENGGPSQADTATTPAASPPAEGAASGDAKPQEAKPQEGAGKPRFAPGQKRSRCRFCQERMATIDYKDIQNLQMLLTPQGKILSRRRSGNCARHQRLAQRAIKQARYIGFLSYTEGQLRGPRMGRNW